MTTMIDAQHLTKRYDKPPSRRRSGLRLRASSASEDEQGTLAVNDVTFSVDKGELFVIMGLSGSGKSSLLRMLNRLVEPTSGSLHIDGDDILAMEPVDLRGARNQTVSMVFQHFALFPHRTVLENAAYGLHVRGLAPEERTARAEEALEVVGLDSWGHVYPSELSGGMRQRVGLARAVATDADILLMDEPFSALDPIIRRDMQDLLLRLQSEMNKTVVFVTHDLNEAMRLGHRIMVMRDGVVIQIGSAAEILASPADDYVANFVSDVDRSRVVTAESILRPPLLTATVDENPSDVLRRLENAEATGVFLLDGAGKVLGVTSDVSLARGVSNGGGDLRSLASDAYATVTASTRLIELMSLVGQHCVPLAVTDDAGRLLGVIPRAVLLGALADQRSLLDA